MAKEKIISMVLDTTKLTLYREDGSTIEIAQGDSRIKTLVDQVMPVVQAGGVAEIDLEAPVNPYTDFQELVSSAVQFFRVAKKVVAPLLEQAAPLIEKAVVAVQAEAQGTSSSMAPVSYGPVPSAEDKSPMQTAVDEIIKHAEPASSPEFTGATNDDETIVAVVETPTGKKAVPGIENLQEQLIYANKLNSAEGVKNLIKRMAAVAEDRMHSVQDLLSFLKQADLPIADDGTVIAYKILRHGKDKSTFVDCHTKRVQQKVGSFVCINEALIDKNRGVECSSGLHICRRGYVGSFGGDTVTLVRVAPEDVMVVPHNDHNKVRVRSYHIIFELDKDAYSKLKSNKPMTDDPKIAKLVTAAIKGHHPAITENVTINGNNGTNVEITQLGKKQVEKKPAEHSNPASKKGPVHTTLDDPSRATNKVDPKKMSETLEIGPRQKQARDLFEAFMAAEGNAARKNAAQAVIDFRRSKKVGWDKLGLIAEEIRLVEDAAKLELAPEPEPEPVAQLSRGDEARKLYEAGAFNDLKALKRKAKVSWSRLGFSEAEETKINGAK